jgi:hypothetical protein
VPQIDQQVTCHWSIGPACRHHTRKTCGISTGTGIGKMIDDMRTQLQQLKSQVDGLGRLLDDPDAATFDLKILEHPLCLMIVELSTLRMLVPLTPEQRVKVSKKAGPKSTREHLRDVVTRVIAESPTVKSEDSNTGRKRRSRPSRRNPDGSTN